VAVDILCVETLNTDSYKYRSMTPDANIDRRSYLKAVGAVGASGALAGCTGGSDDSDDGGNNVINPGTAPGFPPFEYTQDGELVGFDVDLAEAAIERAGYEVGEWTEIEFDSLIPSLTQGNVDLVAAAMTITEDRQQQIAFTDPYYESDQAVLVREGGDLSPESVDDLAGAVVGAQSGTTGQDEVEALVDDGTVAADDVRQYDNYTLGVQDLENGNVDVLIIDIPVAENFADGRAVTIAFTIETGEVYGMGMRQDDDRLADINDALAEMQEDGTYDELVTEWFE
jgi:amino acid ABC transporter substrate-binding protein, PAAT family (TC 3.A.1.3.-)